MIPVSEVQRQLLPLTIWMAFDAHCPCVNLASSYLAMCKVRLLERAGRHSHGGTQSEDP